MDQHSVEQLKRGHLVMKITQTTVSKRRKTKQRFILSIS